MVDTNTALLHGRIITKTVRAFHLSMRDGKRLFKPIWVEGGDVIL
ncbi:MAG TPA: hypothetical protein PKY35_12245 [Candidatus Hydrogenedentes bacterium]|nr:hypothetical protein [Candidatus Hydrogenedentota bacterium]HOL77788.1 hypothetical protein [Candidatus Hydrogenedentota bacterium]HPO86398.1 hypothetical protein [Candidatus Hydrogenedentota bacterium]